MVDGSEVAIEEVPWQVSLVHESEGNSTCFCGGSITSSNWVITAAHCVDIEELEYARTMYVSAGSADYREGSRHTIVDRIPHPGYKFRKETTEVAIKDIALLQVMKLFVFAKTRQPISLYFRAHATLSQSLAIASGWGDIKVEGGDISNNESNLGPGVRRLLVQNLSEQRRAYWTNLPSIIIGSSLFRRLRWISHRQRNSRWH